MTTTQQTATLIRIALAWLRFLRRHPNDADALAGAAFALERAAAELEREAA